MYSAKLYRCIKRGVEHTARGTWSPPESRLPINYLELKAVFFGDKGFQDLCLNNIAVPATDNTTVVTYIKKVGDEVGSSLCHATENPDLVLQKTGDSKPDTFQAG